MSVMFDEGLSADAHNLRLFTFKRCSIIHIQCSIREVNNCKGTGRYHIINTYINCYSNVVFKLVDRNVPRNISVVHIGDTGIGEEDCMYKPSPLSTTFCHQVPL